MSTLNDPSVPVDDDVNPEMTIEELLNEELAYESKLVEAKYEAQIEALKSKFATTKDTLWQTHTDLLAGNFKENLDLNADNAAAGAAKDKDDVGDKKMPAAAKPVVRKMGPALVTLCGRIIDTNLPYVRVKCVLAQEDHVQDFVGKEWVLQPTLGNPCKIGRSKNAHYKKTGISLPKDLEVSTAHGEIGIDKKTRDFYFIDLNSSNGTHLLLGKGEETKLKGMKFYEIVTGSSFRIGAGVYQFTLNYP